MKILGLIFVAILLIGYPLNSVVGQVSSPIGGEMPSDSSTLTDYLAYAALHNPGLQAAFERWQAAISRISPAQSLPDPRFTFSYFIEEIETRVGPQRRSVALTQTFPWLGTLRARGRAATRAADAAEQRYLAAKFDVFTEIKTVYGEYYYLGRQIEITEENVQLSTLLEEQVRTAYSSGMVAHGDVIKAQIELDKNRDKLASLIDRRQSAMARFNAVLNRPAETFIPWPTSLPDVPEVPAEPNALSLLPESPRLKAADFEAESARTGWSAAKREAIPDLTVGLMAIDTGPARMPGVGDSGKDPLAVTFSFNIPLWFGKYRAKAHEKEALFNEKAQLRLDMENRLTAEVEQVLYLYRNAVRQVGLYSLSLVPKAEQHYSVMQTSFVNGQASFDDLIEAQQTLLEFKLDYERARTDRFVHYAALEKLIGRDLSVIPVAENDGH